MCTILSCPATVLIIPSTCLYTLHIHSYTKSPLPWLLLYFCTISVLYFVSTNVFLIFIRYFSLAFLKHCASPKVSIHAMDCLWKWKATLHVWHSRWYELLLDWHEVIPCHNCYLLDVTFIINTVRPTVFEHKVLNQWDLKEEMLELHPHVIRFGITLSCYPHKLYFSNLCSQANRLSAT